MWPFSKRGARANTPSPETAPTLDYAAFAQNDAYIKLWLPEVLDQALNQLSVSHDESKPDVLRGLLFEHVYGRQELEGLIAWKQRRDDEARRGMVQESQTPYEDRPLFQRRFSPRSAEIELFGKATVAIKLWLPLRLKDDLASLAKHDGMGLSDYLRKALVRMLLGEQRHQQWRTAIGDLPADLATQEADDTI
jgi:hypothetical protein